MYPQSRFLMKLQRLSLCIPLRDTSGVSQFNLPFADRHLHLFRFKMMQTLLLTTPKYEFLTPTFDGKHLRYLSSMPSHRDNNDHNWKHNISALAEEIGGIAAVLPCSLCFLSPLSNPSPSLSSNVDPDRYDPLFSNPLINLNTPLLFNQGPSLSSQT